MENGNPNGSERTLSSSNDFAGAYNDRTPWLGAYGSKLIDLGYSIVPIPAGNKRPVMQGWPSLSYTRDMLVEGIGLGIAGAWGAPKVHDSVGVITGREVAPGRFLCALDIDVRDEAITAALLQQLSNMGLGARNRVGKAPKTLIPVLFDRPLTKLTSASFESSESGKPDRIEVLGVGQQFVAYGIHPDTNQPYRWSEDLTEVPAADLPLVSEGQLKAILATYEQLATQAGKAKTSNRSDMMVRNKTGIGKAKHRLNKPLAETEVALLDLLERKPEYNEIYESWLRIGMVLHHEYGETSDEEAALNLWDQLSSRSDRYKEGLCRYKWRTFDRRSPDAATLRLLLHEAASNPDAEAAFIASLTEQYVWDRSTKMFIDVHSGSTAKGLDLALGLGKEMSVVEVDIAAPSLNKALSRHPDLIVVEGADWLPLPYVEGGYTAKGLLIESKGRPKLNNWRGYSADPVPGDTKPWHDLLKWVVPDEAERETLLKRLAFDLQFPHLKPQWQVALFSPQRGVGKDRLLTPVFAIWGDAAGSMTRTETGYDDELVYTKLVLLPEAVITEAGYPFWRSRLTSQAAPTVTLYPKGRPKVVMRDLHSYILTGNNLSSLPLTGQSRRLFVIWSMSPPLAENQSLFARYNAWMADPNSVNALFHELLHVVQVDETFGSSLPFVTKGAEECVRLNKEARGFDKEDIEARTGLFSAEAVYLKAIAKRVKLPPEQIATDLKEGGWKELPGGKLVKVGGKHTRSKAGWYAPSESGLHELSEIDLAKKLIGLENAEAAKIDKMS